MRLSVKCVSGIKVSPITVKIPLPQFSYCKALSYQAFINNTTNEAPSEASHSELCIMFEARVKADILGSSLDLIVHFATIQQTN